MSTERPTEPQPVTDLEQLLVLKEELETLWVQLPAEHQATMALVLLDSVKNSEWGAWLREAIEMQWPVDMNSLTKTFPVLSISAPSLKRSGLSDEEVTGLVPKA